MTATFQQGDSITKYAGTVDTYIDKRSPGNNYAGSDVNQVKMVSSVPEREGLVRFDSIFGSGENQIPVGSTILSATLTVWGGGGGGGNATVHRMLVSWEATSPWNSTEFGGDGIDAADVEYLSTADGDNGGNIADGTPVSYSVAATVQAWSDDPATNFGWVWIGATENLSWYMRSAEHATQTTRPKLDVTFNPPGLYVTEFTVKDQTSHSSLYTDSVTVDVAIAAIVEDAEVSGYMITETPDEPTADTPGWVSPLTAYTIVGAEGQVTLYAWVLDTLDRVACKTADIYFSTASPTISGISATTTFVSATISWETDPESVGWIDYGLAGEALDQVTAFTALDFSQSVTITGLLPKTAYEYVVHGDSAVSAILTFTTGDPGAFFCGFITETPPCQISTAAYNVDGAMIKPTSTTFDPGNLGRSAAVAVPGLGFTNPYATCFSHPTMYGGGSEGIFNLVPPGGVNDPITGTDVNPAGASMWAFSFLMGGNVVMPLDSASWGDKQPSVRLFANRGSDSTMQTILKVRLSTGNMVLDHASGTTILVSSYVPQTAYQFEFIMDMSADTFRVKVNDAYFDGSFTPLNGSSLKGVGGFEARGGSPLAVHWEDRTHFDSISLAPKAFTNLIENFQVSDRTTGSTLMTGDKTVNVSFGLFGPGYTRHIIALGNGGSAPTPADQNDPRWVDGPVPATTSIGDPANGDTVNVALYLLDASNGIQQASAGIMYASGDPGISSVAATANGGEMLITWTTALLANGRVLYDLDGAPYASASAFEPGVATAHSVTLSGLTPASTYHFAVESNGFAGNDRTFDFLKSAVAISGVVNDESQFYSVSISWTTDTDAIGWVEYGPAGEALDQSTAFTAYGTSHSVAISSLLPATSLDFRIRSNGSTSELMTITSKDPGAFWLDLNKPLGTVQLTAYTTAGKMMQPTFARHNGSDRGTSIAPPGMGFTGNYVKMFNHPMLFSAGDMGLLTIEPPSGVTEPIAGTDVNPGNGKLWKLSFDMSSGAVLRPETRTWYENLAVPSTDDPPGFRQPGLQLFTNRGDDNTLQNLLKVRLSESMIVLDHADGTTALLGSYAANHPYHLEFILNMETDTFQAVADGTPVPGVFRLMTGPTAKGVGGFKAAAGSDEWEYNEYNVGFNNIVLTPASIENQATTFTVADPSSGSTTTTDETSVNVNFALQGPGYTHYILAAGGASAPADQNDGRWVPGTVAATLSLGSPADGIEVPVSLWLLDSGNGIAAASTSILYAGSDPGISSIAVEPGVLTATITWNTAKVAGGCVRYDADGAPYDNVAFEEGIGASHSVTLTGLLPGTVYHFAVESNGAASGDLTFDHLTDITAITSIQVVDIGLYSVRVTWDTSSGAAGFVRFDLKGAATLSQISAIDTELVTSHSAVLENLEPNTKYDFQIFSNGSASDVQTASSKAPGLFTLEFTKDVMPTILTASYSVDGRMLRPTDVDRNTFPRGAHIWDHRDLGINSQHVRMWAHGDDRGIVSITPPADVTAPLGTTDHNTPGKPYVFSFVMGMDARNGIVTGNTNNANYPTFGMRLFTNRGADNTMATLLRIRPSNSGIVLDHQMGETVLVAAAAANTPYTFECTLDVDNDTFTVSVDGTPIEGTFAFSTGATAKGIGGFEASGRIPWTTYQGWILYDNISLTGGGTSIAVTSFAVSDQSTGSRSFTNSATVNVNVAADGNVAGYMVTESALPPDAGDTAWEPDLSAYTITGGEGNVTLYAWAKDDAGNVSLPLTAGIYFSTAAPVISNVLFTTVTPGTAVTVTWNTDIPAESAVNYGPVKLDGTTPSSVAEGTLSLSHSVTVSGLTNGTNYKFVLVNNERLSSEKPVPDLAYYWPSIWPIPCDVNRDCKVNILDLISVRNKLNQPVATGDNIYADVNLPAPDGKINILDLIAVRNKLNTSCPQ